MVNSFRIAILLVTAIGSCYSAVNVETHIHIPTAEALPTHVPSSKRFLHSGDVVPANVQNKVKVPPRSRQKEAPFRDPGLIHAPTLIPFRLPSQRQPGISKSKHVSTPERAHSAKIFAKKHRSDGNFKSSVNPAKKKSRSKSKLHVGRNTMPSLLVKSRIVKSEPIEVEPARIIEELPFDFTDDFDPVVPNAITQNIVHREDENKHRTKPLKPPTDTDIFKAFKYPLELRDKPAFCRRCFMFWRSVAPRAPNDKLYEYCCTPGTHSRDFLREYLPPLTAIKFKI